MFSFETTTLWQSSLAPQKKGAALVKAAREELRHAFLGMRERAASLAGEIAGDLPFFTVHDITHLDALWETASAIAGPKFTLTPPEAFVLGGAFLVHDLAMSRAAYPEGPEALCKETIGRDTTAALLRKKLGRVPTPEEIENPGADVQRHVLQELLRVNHAKQAERLPTATWQAAPTSAPYHLIEVPELRETYGRIIGRIAHSHWWNVDQLAAEFKQPLGAPGGFPPGWRVDALKVAALLRVADASHLDDRRAPSFLRALRKPEGISEAHWRFQNNLLQPSLVGDRLVYTAKQAFEVSDATAWWFCYDALRMVDAELRGVDALLADLGNRPRFAARGVAKVESPERLAESVETKGWLPVDARVRVTDVAGLARHIGGEQLYGNNQAVPLREMIQNATDAVRARRLIESRGDAWGEVCVRFGKDEGGDWIEVEDNGIGMPVNVLKGALLDFGASYWDSEQVIRDLPGLLSKGFQPTGQYGIGFFSVFMWGDRVRVTSLRAGEAQRDTHVLEFGSGLSARPVLRDATETEFRLESGTTVRVWTKEPLVEGDEGRLSRQLRLRWRYAQTLRDLCAGLCPALDVDLYVEGGAAPRALVVAARDWVTMEGSDLLKRVQLSNNDRVDVERIDPIAANLRLLKSSAGEVLGRACIAPREDYIHPDSRLRGLITVGGLRASFARNDLAGILIGRSERAIRDQALPVADDETWATWASEQAGLVGNLSNDPSFLKGAARLIRRLGGNTGDLPVARGAGGWLSVRDILKWQDLPDEFLLVSDSYELRYAKLSLGEKVLSASSYGGSFPWRQRVIPGGSRGRYIRVHETAEGVRNIDSSSLLVAVMEALAKAWGASFEEVLRASDFSSAEHVIGKSGGKSVKAPAYVIRNPRASGV
jgi:hypothetical protein